MDPQASLDDVDLELREIRVELRALAERVGDAIGALNAVRNGGQPSEAPAAPLDSPPRPGSAAGEPPASAAEPTAAAPPAPDSSTEAADAPARLDPRRERSIELVRGAFRRLGPGWHGAGSIGGEAGTGAATATACMRDLATAGELEHNGKGGAHSRYRQTGLEHPPDPPPLRPQTSAAPTRQRRAELHGSEQAKISPRVRRAMELERESTAFADRNDGVGTLPGRILEALQADPAGVRTLARRLGYERPTPELVTSLAHMLGTADLVRHRNPDRSIGAETHLYFPAR